LPRHDTRVFLRSEKGKDGVPGKIHDKIGQKAVNIFTNSGRYMGKRFGKC